MPNNNWPPPKAVHTPLSESDKDRLWFGRKRRGRPASDDPFSGPSSKGLLEMALMMVLDDDLKPWPAAFEVAGHLATDNKRENVARRLDRKFRQIKRCYEEKKPQEWMDDELVFTIIMITWQRKWSGSLIFSFNAPLVDYVYGTQDRSLEEDLVNGALSQAEAFLILNYLLRVIKEERAGTRIVIRR